MTTRRAVLHSLTLASPLLCLVCLVSFAQTSLSTSTQQNAPAPQAPLHVESNLVLVPVFVYDQGRMTNAPKEELPCVRQTVALFFKLTATEPYLPKNCDAAQMHGLTVKDFRLYQDGIEQEIRGFRSAAWWTVARDNLGWYMQSSVTPVGIWETSDLSRLKLVPPGINRDFQILEYVPANVKTGCHHIRVEVDRPNALVYARDEYCTGQSPTDPLFGTALGNQIEHDVASKKRGGIPLTLRVATFYTGKDAARVNICLRFPWNKLFHQWDLLTWSLYARIGIMGIVRRNDGTVAARVSDLLYPSYWPTFVQGGAKITTWEKGTAELCGALASEVKGGPAAHTSAAPPAQVSAEPGDDVIMGCRGVPNDITPDLPAIKKLLDSSDPAWLPARYETQIDLPPGDYSLLVAINDGFTFGHVEMPLTIGPYDAKELAISSVALCKRLRDARVADKETAAANFAPQYVPWVSKGIEFTAAGNTTFAKGEPMFAYFETYDPSLAQHPTTAVTLEMRVLAASTGQVKEQFAPLNAVPYEQSGSTTLRIARTIPISQLTPGAYTLQVRASDSAGQNTAWRTANFEIE